MGVSGVLGPPELHQVVARLEVVGPDLESASVVLHRPPATALRSPGSWGHTECSAHTSPVVHGVCGTVETTDMSWDDWEVPNEARAAIAADVSPFPRDETTPPVMKMNLDNQTSPH